MNAPSSAPANAVAPRHERAHQTGAGGHTALGKHGRHPHHIDAGAGARGIRTTRRSERPALSPAWQPDPGPPPAGTGIGRKQRPHCRSGRRRPRVVLNRAGAAGVHVHRGPHAATSSREPPPAPFSVRLRKPICRFAGNKDAPSMRGFPPPLTEFPDGHLEIESIARLEACRDNLWLMENQFHVSPSTLCPRLRGIPMVLRLAWRKG